ncbi:DegT/DnrJ/EryC1/StrS aminotransferase family protein, partial [Vibrio cholerae]|nr:DegT/DnrJ/EryC1/StrS aminotransferase family protein [Vibrio cholerae]
ELGIGCSVHFIPLHLHPYWRDTYKLTPEMYPIAQSIFEAEVSLPLYTKMNDEDLLRVVNAVKQVLTDG